MDHKILQPDQLFATYSLPGDKDFYIVSGKELLDFDYDQSGFVITPFDDSGLYKKIMISADHVLKNTPFTFRSELQVHREIISQNDYLDKVQACINANHARLDKIVLSRIKEVELSNVNLFDLFIRLKNMYPDAFVYLFNIPDVGAWIGASPELLLGWDTIKAQTMALAGTRKFSENDEISWSKKNIKEQEKVSQYISEILSKNNLHYNQSNIYNKRAGNVEHLCTQFDIDHVDRPDQLIDALHPTPAVCGLPLQSAKKFIHEIETHERRYYSGYLGPVGIQEQNRLFVNLRCMELSEGKGYIYVGGGIMSDSVPSAEWIETEQKAQTLVGIIEKKNKSTTYFSGHAI